MTALNKVDMAAKTKELASLMVDRFSMNPVSAGLVNEAWSKEFPDEVAIAARMLVLLDEREADKEKIKILESRNRRLEGIIDAAERRIAELEARVVNLPKRSIGEVMHMSGFSREYAEGWCAGNDNARHEIRAAGIKIKVE